MSAGTPQMTIGTIRNTSVLMTEPIRITEVLSYFKEPWYIDWVHRVGRTEANRISKASMKIGTRVDELIKKECVESNHIATVYKKESLEVQNCLLAYRKWHNNYKPKSLSSCSRLNATIEGQEVTGEPDLMVDDVLVDIKCSTKISPSYWVQVNMYRRLSEQCGKVGILRLDKTTSSYEYIVKEFDGKLCDVWVGLMRAFVYYKGDSHDGAEL